MHFTNTTFREEAGHEACHTVPTSSRQKQATVLEVGEGYACEEEWLQGRPRVLPGAGNILLLDLVEVHGRDVSEFW